jgi:hypothetical protein
MTYARGRSKGGYFTAEADRNGKPHKLGNHLPPFFIRARQRTPKQFKVSGQTLPISTAVPVT